MPPSSAAVKRARVSRSERDRGMLSFVAKSRSRWAAPSPPAAVGFSYIATYFGSWRTGRENRGSRIAPAEPGDSTFTFHFLVMSRDCPLPSLRVRDRVKKGGRDQTGEPDLSGSTWPAQYEFRVEEALDDRW